MSGANVIQHCQRHENRFHQMLIRLMFETRFRDRQSSTAIFFVQSKIGSNTDGRQTDVQRTYVF